MSDELIQVVYVTDYGARPEVYEWLISDARLTHPRVQVAAAEHVQAALLPLLPVTPTISLPAQSVTTTAARPVNVDPGWRQHLPSAPGRLTVLGEELSRRVTTGFRADAVGKGR